MNKTKIEEQDTDQKTNQGRTITADFDFTDFTFLEPEIRALGCDSNLITESDFRKSATYKVINNEFIDPTFSFNDHIDHDEIDRQWLKTKTDTSVPHPPKRRKPVNKRLCPQKSSLTLDEHVHCLQALQLMASSKESRTTSEIESLNIFSRLESRRIAEYKLFSEFVESMWKDGNSLRLMEIQPSLKRFINDYWKCRLTRAQDYPQNYSVVTMLPLHSGKTNCNQAYIEVQPQGLAYECGINERIKFIKPVKFVKYIKPKKGTCDKDPRMCLNQYEDLISKVPLKGIDNVTGKVPVSQDPIAIDLAQKYHVDIVISSSGLKCLLDNNPPNYSREWIIPIVIKEFSYENDHKKSKIIFVDKPLPPVKHSIQGLNQWVHKISLKATHKREIRESFKVQPENCEEQCLPNPKLSDFQSEELPERDVSNIDDKNKNVLTGDDSVDLNLTIDKSSMLIKPDSSNHNGPNLTTKSDLTEDDSDNESLLIDESLLEKENQVKEEAPEICRVTKSMAKSLSDQSLEAVDVSPPSPKKQKRPDCEKDENESQIVSSESSCSQPNKNVDEKSNVGDFSDDLIEKLRPNISDNNGKKKIIESKSSSIQPKTTYRIWKMIEHTDDNDKSCNKELKILIRSKLDGKLARKNSTEEVDVKLVPKLEYQMEFGAECFSLSEIVRQWCTLYFLMSSNIVRVRINPENSTLISYEIKDLQKIIDEVLRVHKHDPQLDLKHLFRILSIMSTSLSPATYILKHEANMKDAAKLYVANQSSNPSQFDLHRLYKNVVLDKLSLQNYSWNPIDPFVITSRHKSLRVLPCLFDWRGPPKKKKRVPRKTDKGMSGVGNINRRNLGPNAKTI